LIFSTIFSDSAKEIFDVVDRDGSGVIDFKEFTSMFRDPLKNLQFKASERKPMSAEEKKQKSKIALFL
jgi:hypothetical protein